MSEEIDLKVVLLAKGVEVAESADPAIWLSTMALITGAGPVVSPSARGASQPLGSADPAEEDLIDKFAQEIGVSREQLEGGAGPSTDSPFIHLDHKYWEALRTSAGTKSVAPIVLAATLLLLWDRHAKIGDVTIAICGRVLKTIDLPTKNASRGLKNCEWLQLRGNAIKLNPAMISKAEGLACKYCARGA